MIKDEGMKESFWGEALNQVGLLHSRTITRTLHELTPHEALLGSTPLNSRIKIVLLSHLYPPAYRNENI